MRDETYSDYDCIDTACRLCSYIYKHYNCTVGNSNSHSRADEIFYTYTDFYS